MLWILSLVQLSYKRRDYPATSEMLQGQVTNDEIILPQAKCFKNRLQSYKRRDYPATSEMLQGQVTKLVNVMRTIAGIDGFSDVS